MTVVGIDVSKGKSTICILRPYGEVVESPYDVLHTEKNLASLVSTIQAIDSEVRIVMEATGAYHLPLLSVFKEAGFFVSVVNPLAMKKYASATLRKGKTDKMDSIRIANYGIDHWFKLVDYALPEDIYEELRLLGRQYSYYIKLRVESKLATSNLLDRTMPGIKSLLNSNRSEAPTRDKLCDFVAEYWHFDNITKKSESQFVRSFCSWAKKKGYHASESKAKKSMSWLAAVSPLYPPTLHRPKC